MWDPSFGNVHFGTFALELSLWNLRSNLSLETSVWGNFRLETFAWELFSLGSLALDLLPGIFRLRIFALELSLASLDLGFSFQGLDFGFIFQVLDFRFGLQVWASGLDFRFGFQV